VFSLSERSSQEKNFNFGCAFGFPDPFEGHMGNDVLEAILIIPL
jgi:hypothetical protein